MTIAELIAYIGENGVVGILTIFFVGGISMFFLIGKEFFKNRELDRKLYESDLMEREETRKVQRELSESIRENTKQYKSVSGVLMQSQEQRDRIESTNNEIRDMIKKLKSDSELSDKEIKESILLIVKEQKEIKEALYYIDYYDGDEND